MGGVVQSVIAWKHERSLVPHETIRAYRAGGPYNVPVSEPEGNCSAIYRLHEDASRTAEDMYKEFYNGVLIDAVEERCKELKDQPAFGIRHLDRIEKTTIVENGKSKPWEYIHFKPTVELTYGEVWDRMINFGRGLRAIGVKPNSRCGLYEDTRAEWIIACYGMWSQGITGVTVYANLGDDALEYAIKESEICYIVCNGKLVPNVIKLCRHAGVPISHIIYTDTLPANCDIEGTELFPFEDVLEKGRQQRNNPDYDQVKVQPDDLALIMYTSGTTGDPKGVMMTHGNTHAATKAVVPRLKYFLSTLKEGEVPRYVAYLPLAHILEFTVENGFILRGAYIGFGTPRTLTSVSARPHGDFEEFKPQFIAGVPRVYDTVRKAVESKIPDGLKRRLYEYAYEQRRQCLLAGMDTPYLNDKIFATVRQTLGGNCGAALSGGAPLSAKTQEWVSVAGVLNMIQGYGLTETCAITSTQMPGDTAKEQIGVIMPGCEVKLRDVDEWLHTDDPPRGELLVRGAVVTKGYYKQEAMTKEAWDKDGWFATGDVASISKDGIIKIVGRVKALAKNVFGEYVSLDALEVVYVLNDLCVPNGVCVLVDSMKPYICALVCTDEPKAMKFAKLNGIEGTWPDILSNPEFHAKAALSLAATAKTHGKKPFECVKNVRVLSDTWTPENGILTAAQKLKRREVDKQYSALIQELFKSDN